ncbi:MAG: hypothetical protein LC747_08805 [Acidobacteria bacterium]|nr:hypothetical protein [Acidobacteriota bacterium]
MRRQFQQETTLARLIFDITVGIVLPILCLTFDPIVFRNGILGQPLAGRFQLFAYSVIAVEIIALAVWLGLGERAGEWCGVLGGIMLAGALFSTIIGICLLPFSLIGLMFLVGVFGFTPFLTAFIYLRNARRALIIAGAQLTLAGLFITLMLGATLALGAPAFAHWRVGKLIESSMAEVLGGDDSQAKTAARRLRQVSWLASGEIDQVAWAYGRETDPARKERLARAYHDITGGDIEHRLLVLND